MSPGRAPSGQLPLSAPGPSLSTIGGRGTNVKRRPVVGTLVLEAQEPSALAGLDLTRADEWRILVTWGGVPADVVHLPRPGRASERMLTEAVLDRARWLQARERLLVEMRRDLGLDEPATAPVACSVVVCTHRRPEGLTVLLPALARLDPAPAEVVIVDNDPGQLACRDFVESHGFRYVREDRRGLNNARVAGLHAARGDVVAFTDDDCEPPAHWLRQLPELFADLNVAAVTGPAFPARLDTPSKVDFEDFASFNRGLGRRVFDWQGFSPCDAGRCGAGANMVVRADVLDPSDLFSPELDAGTPTQSGGDTFALYRLLAEGHRVVYDPATFTFHHHRGDPEALHRGIRGYGTGHSSAMLKMLVEGREPGVLRPWSWLASQWLRIARAGIVGRADRLDVDVATDYVRGGVAGPRAWLRARREAPARRSTPKISGAPPRPAGPGPQAPARPAISVVVPTIGRMEALEGCLDALVAQDHVDGGFEVIVVDDTPSGELDLSHRQDRNVTIHRTGGKGAACARDHGVGLARGEVILFLDDDLEAAPDLVGIHLRAHRAPGSRVVIGYSRPAPRNPTLAARAASLWWEDHFRAKAASRRLMFTDVLSGNMSVPRRLLDEFGSFDLAIGVYRREDWEWGLRMLKAGVEVDYLPEAVADHRFGLTTRGRLGAARAEGHGDALLLARHPEAIGCLPAASYRARRPLRDYAVAAVVRGPVGAAAGMLALDVLERLRARRAWAGWCSVQQAAYYRQGFRAGGGPELLDAALAATRRVQLTSGEAVEQPEVVAPRIVMKTRSGRSIEIGPVDGQWSAGLADQLAAKVPWWDFPHGSQNGEPDGDWTVLDAAPADDPVEFWSALDHALRTTETVGVLTPMPGVKARPGWAARAAPALEAERVALVLGESVVRGTEPGPLELKAATDGGEEIFPFVGRAPRYIGIRREAFHLVGGFDLGLASLGLYAPLLDLALRALDEDLLVARRNVPGLPPDRHLGVTYRRINEWRLWRSRGALSGARGVRRLHPARGVLDLPEPVGAMALSAVALVAPRSARRSTELMRLMALLSGFAGGRLRASRSREKG